MTTLPTLPENATSSADLVTPPPPISPPPLPPLPPQRKTNAFSARMTQCEPGDGWEGRDSYALDLLTSQVFLHPDPLRTLHYLNVRFGPSCSSFDQDKLIGEYVLTTPDPDICLWMVLRASRVDFNPMLRQGVAEPFWTGTPQARSKVRPRIERAILTAVDVLQTRTATGRSASAPRTRPFPRRPCRAAGTDDSRLPETWGPWPPARNVRITHPSPDLENSRMRRPPNSEQPVLRLAETFSRFPAGRYRQNGPYSGEAFRDDHLIPRLRRGETLTVDLDGTRGYASSFLEEAFGGLVRSDRLTTADLQRLTLLSGEDPSLITEITGYLTDAQNRRRPDGKEQTP